MAHARGGCSVEVILLVQAWACNLCKKKQDLLVKTGQWYHGGMAKPVQLDIEVTSDTASIATTEASTPSERRVSLAQGYVEEI